MALHTSGRRMSTGQRKGCLRRVIEGRRRPAGSGVAQRTGLWESGSDVVRVRRRLEVLQMAGLTRRTQRRVLVIHMTRSAGDRCVFPGQWESRAGVVVECRRNPRRGCVACLAVLREPCCGVIRIRAALVVR